MNYTAISKLKPGMRLGRTLPGIARADKYTMGYPLSEEDILLLDEKGFSGVYTMENPPSEILSNELMCACMTALKKTDLNALLSLSEQMVTELKSRPLCLDFKSIRSYDDYLLHHSICVAVYAVSIGIQMGITETRLRELALAGLLHDIGFLLSDQTLLLKKETLTAEEYEQIKKHPQTGYDFVKKEARIPTAVQEAILHHHENVNGTGYPEKQTDDTLTPYARILHVADVYDAIMSKRPYKKGMSGADALNYLIGGKMILFDERIVDKFLEIAVPYPTGVEVLLSNKETARVIGQTSDSLRPLLYMESKQQIVNLETNPEYEEISIENEADYSTRTAGSISSDAAPNAFLAHSHTRKKIMIVDDIFVSIAYSKLALGEDYDIVTCLGGSKAAAMAKAEMPDLILMDYEMPDLDGVSTVMEIHKLGLHMPIIFLTGKCDKETVRACGQCGAADYILKPANPVYLRTRVAMALQNIDGNAFV